MAPLAAAGLRVVAPDQRGYNLSDKPAGIAAYALDSLADDVAGPRRCARPRALRGGRARLGRGRRLAPRGATPSGSPGGHPQRTASGDAVALRAATRPAVKSWYVYFQLPRLPELTLRAGGFWVLRRVLTARSVATKRFAGTCVRWSRRSSGPFQIFTSLQMKARARQSSFRRRSPQLPRGLGAARGADRDEPELVPRPAPWRQVRRLAGRIRVPVRVIWGDARTPFSTAASPRPASRCATGARSFTAPRTHWVQHEEPTGSTGCCSISWVERRPLNGSIGAFWRRRQP